MSNVLVVYYSRTGHTRRLAEEIAALGGWDLEAIVDRRRRDGRLGYLRASVDAVLARPTVIEPPRRDPGDYDLVIVGTPVWYMAVSSPVRTWLRRQAVPRVAFALTCGGRGSERAFAQMAALAGRDPVATLAIKARELAAGAHRGRAADWVAALREREH